MSFWVVVVPAERYEAERLGYHETLELTGADTDPAARPEPGDEVLLVVRADPPAVFGLGRVTRSPRQDDPDDEHSGAAGSLAVAYTRRLMDAPQPVDGLRLDGGLCPLDEAAYRAVAASLPRPATRRSWLVGLDLPIEAESPAEAVRQFWAYVNQLGPNELPVFVSPAHDELAMRAYLLTEPVNLDPEEDEEEG
jgi:hypothetical protein